LHADDCDYDDGMPSKNLIPALENSFSLITEIPFDQKEPMLVVSISCNTLFRTLNNNQISNYLLQFLPLFSPNSLSFYYSFKNKFAS